MPLGWPRRRDRDPPGEEVEGQTLGRGACSRSLVAQRPVSLAWAMKEQEEEEEEDEEEEEEIRFRC